MMSKNEMKANHNSFADSYCSLAVGKYDVKERDESKSQLKGDLEVATIRWQI